MESDFSFLASAFSDGFLNGIFFSTKDVWLKVKLLEKAFGRPMDTLVNLCPSSWNFGSTLLSSNEHPEMVSKLFTSDEREYFVL